MAAPTVASLSVVIDGLKEDVRTHDAWINGNGVEGAKRSLVRLDARLQIVEGKIDKLQGAIIKAALIIGSPLLIATGGFLWALLTHQIELVMH